MLREVSRIYREEPDKVAHNAGLLVEALKERQPSGTANVNDEVLSDLTTRMVGAVDGLHGGLSGAPKFPQWSFFWLLWRGAIRYDHAPARQAVEITLANICQGGIYDHLGGGFARYSVDARWLAPHFEKMLYDNALLMDLMCEVFREGGNELYARRIDETAQWLLREMIADGGGFAASLDADSEGEEGKFYVWTKAEIVEVLGEADAAIFCVAYDVSDAGNWEGHTILNRLHNLDLGSPEPETALADMRAKLLARRAGRIRPGWDDKVLADWNGLMIAALAHAARVFERPEWLAAAETAFKFVQERMQDGGGRLIHSYRAGQAKAPATASDYANMIWGALRLYQATNSPAYLEAAERWCSVLEHHYWVADGGGYAFTADDTPDVIVRMRGAHDDATPNANAIMVSNLVALHLLTGKQTYLDRAMAIPQAFAADLGKNTLGHCGVLAGAFDLIAPQQVVVIRTADEAASVQLARAMLHLSLPGAVQQVMGESELPSSPALAGKSTVNGQPTAYACLGPTCSLPVTNADAFVDLLRTQRQASTPV